MGPVILNILSQLRCTRTFARQFAVSSAILLFYLAIFSNDNLTTMPKLKIRKRRWNIFAMVFKITELSFNTKFDKNSELWNILKTAWWKFTYINLSHIFSEILMNSHRFSKYLQWRNWCHNYTNSFTGHTYGLISYLKTVKILNIDAKSYHLRFSSYRHFHGCLKCKIAE